MSPEETDYWSGSAKRLSACTLGDKRIAPTQTANLTEYDIYREDQIFQVDEIT